MIKYRVNFLGL